MMKTNTGKILLVTTIIAIAIICSMLFHNKTPEVIDKTDTLIINDTTYLTDTFKIIKPVPKYIHITKTDTVYDENGDSLILETENKTYQDTIICQGDTIEITNYITGINATLDSLKVNLKKREIIKTVVITNYVTKPKSFKDHFNVGPSVTAGYDMINRNWGVMAGLSFNVTF